MVSLDTFRKLAAALPEVRESEHFKLLMFGVGKKNFASFDPRSGEMSLRLPLSDPGRQKGLASGVLSEIPGKYGAQGWTLVDLEKVGEPEFAKLLSSAHAAATTAPKASKGGRSVPARG